MVQLLNLFQYYYKDPYLSVDQIVDPTYPLHFIHKKHSKNIAKSMHVQGNLYEIALMTVWFSVELNSDGSLLSGLCDETEG